MPTNIRGVKGWGEDSDQRDRPGVPAEVQSPHPVGGAYWIQPEQEPLAHDVMKHPGRKTFTPVFGSSPGLKGVSGVIRKFAHERIQDHRPTKWMLLLLADRVDVMERRLAKLPVFVPFLAAGSVAGLLTWRILARER